MNQSHETKYITYKKRGRILKAIYKPGIYIDYETAKQVVADRIKFYAGEKLAVIIYDGGITNISKEARTYLASKEANRHIKARAIINRTPLTSVAGNFFIRFDKPVIPCRLFREERNAVKWLKNFV